MICTHQQSSIVYIYILIYLLAITNSLRHGHSHHVVFTRVNLRPKWTMASTAKCPLGPETTENYQYLMVKTAADSRSVHRDSKLAAVRIVAGRLCISFFVDISDNFVAVSKRYHTCFHMEMDIFWG